MSLVTCEIIRSFLPIFYISKIFGCNLYSLPKTLNSRNVNIPLNAIDILTCLAQFAFHLFIILPLSRKWANYNSNFSEAYANTIRSSGMVVIVFIGQRLQNATIFINLFIMIMDMRNSGNIRRILFSLINFDKQMEQQDITVNSSHKGIVFTYGITTVFYQPMTLWLSWILSQNSNNIDLIFIIETYIGHAMIVGCMSSYLTTYWYLLAHIADRFCIVNKSLRKYLMRKRDEVDTTYNHIPRNTSKQVIEDFVFLRSLSNMYQSLVNTISRMSRCNSLQFVFSTAVVFLLSVIGLFMFYQGVRLNKDAPAYAIFYSIITIHYSFLLYKTISVGSKIRKQRQISQSLINKAISLQKNKMLSVQLNHFSNQIGHSNVAVSCGIFTVDWTLMYTLTTAMATYSLLFIQFDSIASTQT